MNLQQVTTLLREDLDDQGITFFADSDIAAAVQNAYNRFCLLTGCIETTIRLTLSANVPYYDLSALIPHYYLVTEAFNLSNRRHLSFLTQVQLLQLRSDYELWNGTPQYITIVDYKRVGFFPVPTGPLTLILKVRLTTDTLVATSNLKVQNYMLDPLLELAKVELYEQMEEIIKAGLSNNSFIGGYKDSKGFANGRSLPNMVIALRGVNLNEIKGASVNGV